MRLNDLINQELGRYRIETLIGQGGMAAVYRAFDTRLHRHVALKVLYPQYLADPDIVERFRREAITAAQLDHPFIAPIFDVGEAEGLIYLAMKLLPGPSLAELLQRERRLSPERARALTYEIASALDEAHRRGIIHRDIKPGNVLFDDRGRAVLTDFGIAKSLDAPSLTESSVIVGTPDYIAPEQIDPRLAPDGKLDHRADLYALGAMLYRALTGRRPFDGPAQTVLLAQLRDDPPLPSSIVPELPSAVDAVLLKAMAKQPAHRYSSALELAQALDESLGDQTEVGTIFPPTAIRRDAHTRPTTQVGPPPAVVTAPLAAGPAVAAVATLPAAVPAPEADPAPARRWSRIALLLLAALLLAGGGGVIARWMPLSAAEQPTTPAVATGATTTATATPTATPEPSATITPEPSATTTPEPSATITPEPSATTTPEPSATTSPPATGGQVIAGRPTTRPAPPTTRPAPPTARPTDRPVPPTAQPTAAPTNPPPPPPTATPATPNCTVALAGGFGNLWRTNKAVRDALGCPSEPERAGYSVEQLFQGGSMYYRDDTKQFWVFNAGSSTWRLHTDVYQSDPEPTEEPPAGLYKPSSGFGRLWQKYPAIRAALGWGTTPETPFTGVVEYFEGGMMLYVGAVNDHGPRIHVLYNSGVYDVFRDTYTGP